MGFVIAGFLGGLLRGGMGLFKYMTSYKDVEIRPFYFLSMVIFSGIIGYVSALVAWDVIEIFLEIKEIPWTIALVVGYAGGDFMENIFKIIIREPQLFDLGRKIKENILNEEERSS